MAAPTIFQTMRLTGRRACALPPASVPPPPQDGGRGRMIRRLAAPLVLAAAALAQAAEIDVLAAADTSPSFFGAVFGYPFIQAGVPVRPFQMPAATGGNGAITYTVTGLPPGLRFDATGTDADGCPGTTPRTVCGTAPATAGSYYLVRITAEDADSNRSVSDRASYAFWVRMYGASISSTNPSQLAGANLNTATVAVSLAHTSFLGGVTASDFELVTDIPDLSISQVSGAARGTTTATLTLAFTGDFSTDRTLAVRVKNSAHLRGGDLTTPAVSVLPLPQATLVLSPSSISENGGVATVTAVLDRRSSRPTTVTVTSVAGAYTAGSDATIMIAAGQTANASDTATVTAADDTIHQGSSGRSVTVTATLANGQGAGPVTGAALTLTDDETLPTVSLALAPSLIAEEGGVSTVTATLSGASSEAVTVTVAAAAGNRAAAADFTLSTATTLTIAAGSTASAGTVTVTANGNNMLSGNKSVTMSGTSAGGNSVANPAAATLTITDDDAPRTTLVLSPSSVTESGGVATVTAVLDRQSPTAVTVTVSAAAGANASAGDFTLSASTTLTFAANATASTGLVTVTVTATDNDTDAPDKGVTVSGTASDGLDLAKDPPAVTLTITDDDAAPDAVLSVNPASIAESGAGNVSTVTAVLSHPSSQPTTVTVTSVAGAYTAGSDATIVIAAGQTANASDTATVTAADDTIHQGSSGRSVTVTATLANGQGAGSATGAALTLTDDEALPTVSLALAPSSIAEEGGVSTVTATLSGVSDEAVTVTVAAAAGTRAAAADFTLSTSTTLTIAAGSTASAGTVTVTANGNNMPSGNKSVTMTGTSAGGNGVANPAAATLTIIDDEALPPPRRPRFRRRRRLAGRPARAAGRADHPPLPARRGRRGVPGGGRPPQRRDPRRRPAQRLNFARRTLGSASLARCAPSEPSGSDGLRSRF